MKTYFEEMEETRDFLKKEVLRAAIEAGLLNPDACPDSGPGYMEAIRVLADQWRSELPQKEKCRKCDGSKRLASGGGNVYFYDCPRCDGSGLEPAIPPTSDEANSRWEGFEKVRILPREDQEQPKPTEGEP